METPKESAEELKERLSPDQYYVTQQAGTEPAFSGCYWDTKEEGVYHCIVCNAELFSSETKYDSGTGWPSFSEATNNDKVSRVEDRSHGMIRIEAICATCGAHLGHIFKDGPPPTGERFCMNSASLRLQPNSDS
ncbi:MAG: peptide-methionine (R)-S-oxide reductase [Acidimicrobiaceae bacterium]|nr:peptide-methionine (R)-S-oxide reductase [Acidimicrobiaceae bacterium]|tara:strand:- start:1751 stop:2152 length:402 start_codon:yes stop_codon:yes gene_type:complete